MRQQIECEMIDTIRSQYELFGFQPIETPAVERMDVLTAKGGMGRQIYTVGKPEGTESKTAMGLHFDLTVPLARYVACHANDLTFPFRRYQIQKVWRGERAQRGRFREFYQCDIDVVGRQNLDDVYDAEIPAIISSVFEAIGVSEHIIHVSDRRIWRDVAKAFGWSPEMSGLVLQELDKSQRDGLDTALSRMTAQGVEDRVTAFVRDMVSAEDFAGVRQVFESSDVALDGLRVLENTIATAVLLGCSPDKIHYDLTIARGLDYYTGTVFETFIPGREEWGSVCSGGRYDDLSEYFSKEKFPGVGVSIGLSRLLNLLVDSGMIDGTPRSATTVLVTVLEKEHWRRYLELARDLRNAGIATIVYLEDAGLGKQLGYASDLGIPYAIIAGGNEWSAGCVKIKDLNQRTEDKVACSEVVSYIAARR